jgi:hypothetical protein
VAVLLVLLSLRLLLPLLGLGLAPLVVVTSWATVGGSD